MVRDILHKHITNSLERLGFSSSDVELSHPSVPEHGDYATSIALKLKDKVNQNPREIAQQIADELQKDEELKKIVAKIEIAGPGFINFWLSNEFLISSMVQTIELEDRFGKSEKEKGKNVIIEYTDPNPFKEFHIGHLYSNSVGESIAKLFEAQNANVQRACYQGDKGIHVANSLYGLEHPDVISGSDLEKMPNREAVKVMGDAYARGTAVYESSEEGRKEIQEINRKIYEEDPSVMPTYNAGKQVSLKYFDSIYDRLRMKFNYFFFESESGQMGKQIISEHPEIFEKSEGAIVFHGEKYGLHTRVFINSHGLPTYEAKDLGLPFLKQRRFQYDESIIVTGNEVNEYFKVVLKALELINPEIQKKTKHISHGMVRLPEGKMSSRTGKIITGESLIEEVKGKIREVIKKNESLSVEEKAEIEEGVAIGAIKYSLLKVSIGSDVIFDINESISFDGNSGPYLQYTYARCKSVLEKGGEVNKEINTQNYELKDEELSLLRTFYKYPETVLEAGKNFAPNLIANYLYDLAQKYNLFYQKVPILNSEENEKQFRLALTAATAQVLKNGLTLLGIPVLEKM